MTYEEYEKRLQKEIYKKSSFMNLTKWKFLFSIICDFAEAKDYGYASKVKFLLDDKLFPFSLPKEDDYYNEKYLESFYGTYQLKEIEWIFFPLKTIYERKNRHEFLTPKIKQHHIEELLVLLGNSGKNFEYELSEDGLKIFGYR